MLKCHFYIALLHVRKMVITCPVKKKKKIVVFTKREASAKTRIPFAEILVLEHRMAITVDVRYIYAKLDRIREALCLNYPALVKIICYRAS